MSIDPAAFIQQNLRIIEPPFAPGVRLYQSHSASRLSRLTGDAAPYWAYTWAGGVALVRHLLRTPGIVAGCRVLDLGAGSGLVGIVAAQLGAAQVIAAEIDPNGAAAIALNATLNGLVLSIETRDLLSGDPPDVDLVLVGDLYYAPDLAARVTPFLRRCLASGAQVLVGDPGRDPLPLDALEEIARYDVPDFGENGASGERVGRVYTLRPAARAPEGHS